MNQQGLLASKWQVFRKWIWTLRGSFRILFLLFFNFGYVLDIVPINLIFHI